MRQSDQSVQIDVVTGKIGIVDAGGEFLPVRRAKLLRDKLKITFGGGSEITIQDEQFSQVYQKRKGWKVHVLASIVVPSIFDVTINISGGVIKAEFSEDAPLIIDLPGWSLFDKKVKRVTLDGDLLKVEAFNGKTYETRIDSSGR